MTLYSAQQLRKHAHDLATGFGVTLIEVDDPRMQHEQAVALPDMRLAVCTPIIDETTYAIALHELGHVANPAGHVRDARTADSIGLTVFEEEAAWAWARHYAMEWTAVMEQCVEQWALSGYRRALAKDQKNAQLSKQRIDWNKWTK